MGTTVVKCTTGVMGAGKSYSRMRWVLEEFLPKEEGILYTNVPLDVYEISKYMVKKGYDELAIKKRIHIIPKNILDGWKRLDPKTGMPPTNPDFDDKFSFDDELTYKEISFQFLGPWQYFQDLDLSAGHIMIDEIQKIVDNRSTNKLKKLWADWLSTIRHEGCTLEFMTQTTKRLPMEIKDVSEITVEILPNAENRFPLLPIKNYDYYQLFKKLFDWDLKSSTLTEWMIGENSKRKVVFRKKYSFKPFFYRFYDTNNNEESGKSGTRKKEEWERLSHIGIILWFLRRNFFQVCLIFLYLYLGFMLLFGDGFNRALGAWRGSQKEKVIEIQAKKLDMTVEQYKQHLFKEEIKKELSESYESKILDLKKHIQSSQIILESPQSRAEQLPKQVLIRLTFLSPQNDYCILSDNKTYFVGDKYQDKRLTEIDFKTRRIFFDDESILSY